MHRKTAHELHSLLINHKLSSLEMTLSLLDHLNQTECKINAYVSLVREKALQQAKEADQKIKEYDNITPLTGIPIAIKDNMCTKGMLTTCSSKILANYIPPYDATVITKIKAAGAIIIGKTNMDEFAMGSSTENSGFYPTLNPWNTGAVAGGSSGGSAAAVAADETILATGSDTGGSIRQPAAFCGVVGFKPTYGRVSRYGLIAFASSLDQIGPITKDVTDCAILMNTLAGYDPRDSTSVNLPVPDYRKSLINNIKEMKIGYIKEALGAGIDKEVKETIDVSMKKLEELGAKLVEISMPHFEYAVATYYLIAPAEASSNLGRYDGVKFGLRNPDSKDLLSMYYETRSKGFGNEVKRRIMLGTYALSAGYYEAYYLKALKTRTLIKQDFSRAFEKCDLLISPTAPSIAFKLGEKSDPLSIYLSDIMTIPVNLAGLPAISIPCGISNGLPVGLQIIGKEFAEEAILRAAFTFEQNTNWHKQKPVLVNPG